jgi:hypothetical protein
MCVKEKLFEYWLWIAYNEGSMAIGMQLIAHSSKLIAHSSKLLVLSCYCLLLTVIHAFPMSIELSAMS